MKLENDHEVLAHIAGRNAQAPLDHRLAVGDKVKMEMSPYDLDKGRRSPGASTTNANIQFSNLAKHTPLGLFLCQTKKR